MTVIAWLVPALVGLVLLVWLVRTATVYSARTRGPVLSAETIPDVPPQGLVSVVVPAKDEEGNIEAALETLLAQDYPDLEVIVVDDRSRDATAAIVRRVAEGDGRVRLVQVTELPEGWFGKPHAMHVGAAEARGRWLLFVDADCRQAPHSVRAGVHFLADAGGDVLSLWPVLEMHGFWENTVQPVAGSVLAAWFRPGWVNDPDRRTAFANGQYILMRRETYEAVGGHAAVRNEMVEDIAMARCVKRAGHRLLNAVGRDLFTTRMYDSLGAMYRGWARIYSGAFKRPGLLLVVLAATGTFTLVPYLALAGSAGAAAAGVREAWVLATLGLSAAAVVFLLVTMRRFFQLGRANPWCLVFYPMAVVLVLAFEAGALVRALGLAGITWRGTTYKGGRVVGKGGS
ncbi:MAG: glycosyltransferase family 2 protein [Phycisphaerae bacterium]